MAENAKVEGRHLLTEKDFVEVVDDEGNELPPVPKHWGEEQLPAGASFVKGKSGSSSSTGSTAKKAAAKKTAAKKAASSSDASGDSAGDAGGSDDSGSHGSSESGTSE
jgi:hypothetical protein